MAFNLSKRRTKKISVLVPLLLARCIMLFYYTRVCNIDPKGSSRTIYFGIVYEIAYGITGTFNPVAHNHVHMLLLLKIHTGNPKIKFQHQNYISLSLSQFWTLIINAIEVVGSRGRLKEKRYRQLSPATGERMKRSVFWNARSVTLQTRKHVCD